MADKIKRATTHKESLERNLIKTTKKEEKDENSALYGKCYNCFLEISKNS